MKRTIPNVPSDLSRFGQLRPGEMEILIDETGKVAEAKFTKPIHPVYDSLVIAATRSWRYDPARADGVPVKFRINLKVTISETNRNQQ
jgi:outer membrane biosynthesis protein TonB